MRAWPAPELPVLPGSGLPGRSASPLRLHDTSTGAVTATQPGATARLYVCGITPYDATHIGHAATYVTFDLVHRAWLDAGHDVHYVQNVTDVDDPLLERADRDGEDWRALAERETALFREDMTALRVIPPRAYVGVVEAMPTVAAAVGALREKGAAYDVDGDVYFAVDSDPRFGSLGRLDDATMLALFAERGGDPDRVGKKHPLDCLLWKAARPGEPSWPTDDPELPPGRPGWHVECTAIALEHLGAEIDVQGGGSDLIFPHHEMSSSGAQVLTGRAPFARHNVHAGLVGLGGEKMSKSRGNLVFVSALRGEGRDPMALRLALLGHHYRGDWSWTDGDLAAAEERLARWRTAVAGGAAPSAGPVLSELRLRLADDLDAPGALAVVDRWADAALSTREAEAAPDNTPDAARTGIEAGSAAARQVANAVDALLGIHL